MTRVEIYDKAKYHYEGDYPLGLPRNQAYVHTGFFLGWMTDHDLLSSQFIKDFNAEIQEFRDRKVTGPDLYRRSGGVFDDTMVNEEGNLFTRYYFDFDNGKYIRDYEELLATDLPTFYHAEDSWVNYKMISNRIDERYLAWKSWHRAT